MMGIIIANGGWAKAGGSREQGVMGRRIYKIRFGKGWNSQMRRALIRKLDKRKFGGKGGIKVRGLKLEKHLP